MEIRPVTTRADRRAFIRLPWAIYAWDKNWVPPLLLDQETLLDPAKNPFFQHAEMEMYLAWSEGVAIGRIAAILDRSHNEFHGERTLHFGFFECVDDVAVARALVDRAKEMGRARGMTTLRGPVNPSTNETCGMLIEGFDSPPVIMMTYNPRYYLSLMERVGLAKAKDLYAWYCDQDIVKLDQLRRVTQRVKERHKVTFRSLDLSRFDEEVGLVHGIYNRAWEKNWGFVPMTEAEFRHMGKNLKPVIVPELAFVAESDGKPAGFILGLPDLNLALIHANGRLFPFGLLKILWHARKIRTCRIITLGVVPEFRKRGIEGLLIFELIDRAPKYPGGELSWILEDNRQMNGILETMGARLYKRYRIYEAPIE